MGLAHEKKSYLQEKNNLFEIGSFHNAEKRFRDSIVMGRIWIGKDCITPHSRRYIRKAYVEYCTP